MNISFKITITELGDDLADMVINYSPPGEIAPEGCWVGMVSCYMYIGDTLDQLLINTIEQWENEKNLIG